MKIVILLLSIVTQRCIHENVPDTISAVQIQNTDYRYENDIQSYMNSEEWTIWSIPFRSISCSSVLPAQGSINYDAANLSDHNLTTAWIEGDTGYGIGTKIEVTFNYSKNTFFGSAYEFYGVINLFNGYCKSLNVWRENSRVKSLKVYYNEIPFCFIELTDTWHLQYFDISKFFRNSHFNKNMDAPYEIKEGDRLIFEIVDVYEGSKYKDVAISEFMIEGAKN